VGGSGGGSFDADWGDLQKILSGIQGIATSPIAGVVAPRYTPGMLMGNGDIGVVAGDTATTQKFYFGKNDFWGSAWDAGHMALGSSILSLGTLSISSTAPGANPNGVYRMVQDILNAEVDTTMALGAATVTMRSWTADTDNVFVTELSTPPGSSDVVLTVDLAMPPVNDGHATYPATAGTSAGAAWVTRENNLTGAGDFKSRAAIALALVGASLSGATAGAVDASGTLTLKGGTTATLVAVVRSDARIGLAGSTADSLKTDALTKATSITASDVDAMRSSHRGFWKDFWLQSYVQVSDAALDAYYYGALYALGCAARSGKTPPGIWGNFVTNDYTGWGSRYFMNYNFQAAFYGVGSSNRLDMMQPFMAVQLGEAPFEQTWTAHAGYQGLAFHRTFTPFDQFRSAPGPAAVASTQDPTFVDQKSNASFGAMLAIDYYEYSQDTDYLQKQLYPHLKLLDAFWRSYVTMSGGRYVVEHSSAHEGSDDTNPNLDLGFIRRIAKTLIATSTTLGVDANLRPTWQDLLDKLSPYPTGTYNGKTVYLIAETVKGSTDIATTFEPTNQPINMEGSVFPGGNLALGGDPAELQIAIDTLTQMNSWGLSGGSANNGFCKEFPIAARVGWPADDLATKFKTAIAKHWRASNLTAAQGGGGIETSGSIEAVDSMLLQSEGGTVRVFPVWSTAKDAYFKRLRAKGAFLVSSQMTGGQVTYVDVTSEKGSTLTFQSPWSAGTPTVAEIGAGGAVLGPAPFTASGGVITVPTAAGHTYRISH
jgi:hypothetical protein